MSGLRRAVRHPDRGRDPHVHARTLASDRLLEPLLPDELVWLDAHLGRCATCREFAAGIAADQALLATLRDAPATPPRDLGARLAGALDAEVREAIRAGRRVPDHRPAASRPISVRHDPSGIRGRNVPPPAVEFDLVAGPPARRARTRSAPRTSLAFTGLAAAAILAILALPILTAPDGRFALGPGPSPTANVAANPGPTPMRVAAGPIAWVQRGSDGRYVLNSAPVDEVCPGVDASACGTLDGTAHAVVSLDVVPSSVVLGKRGDVAVVVGGDAVYAVNMPAVARPTPEPTTSTSPSPAATPARTGASTTPPVDTPVPSGSPAVTPGSSASAPATPTVSVASTTQPEPTPTASAAAGGSAPPSGAPSATPGATPAEATPGATDSGLPSETPAAPSSTPVAGSSATPPASAAPTPSPVPTPDVTIPPATPAPTAAQTLAIASGVVVVGAAASYSTDGHWVAFSARPSDGSSGPDVYAWRVGSARATPITHDGVSQFSGWYGGRILLSRTVVDDVPATRDASPDAVVARAYLADPATGDAQAIAGVAWRPVVDPTQRRVAFWRGLFAWSEDDHTWMPSQGRLVIGDWEELQDGSGGSVDKVPWSASIADGAAWDVDWDPSGRRLAVWIAEGAGDLAGRLTLFTVQSDGSLGSAVVKEAPALGAFSLDADRLAWATPPGQDGAGSSISVFAWNENGAGHLVSNPAGGSILVAP